MQGIILFVLLASTYLMVIAKRTPALIRSFRYQSLCLFGVTFIVALTQREPELYVAYLPTYARAAVPFTRTLAHMERQPREYTAYTVRLRSLVLRYRRVDITSGVVHLDIIRWRGRYSGTDHRQEGFRKR